MGHVMPNVIRPLHVLWHEVIGFLFLALAVILGSSAYKSYRHLSVENAGIGRMLLSFSLPALLAYFGITAFLRARKISRS